MLPSIKIFVLCPIPEDQKPINEYIVIKENLLLNWTTLEIKKYKIKLISLFIFISLSVGIYQENLWKKNFLEAFFNTFSFSISLILFYLVFALIRWQEIKKRFDKSRLFYEEASWFDGEIWEKPFFLIKNDKIISSQKIKSIIKRLRYTIFFSSCSLVFLVSYFEFI
jgi:hypothetical protein